MNVSIELLPKKRSSKASHPSKVATRGRPQLATTVAPETLAALSRLSGAHTRSKPRALGTLVDWFVWAAVEHRLTLLYAFGSPKASTALPSVDKMLLASLTRHKRAFLEMDPDARCRRAAELQSAHEARVACGAWSTLDEFVARFVARQLCHPTS